MMQNRSWVFAKLADVNDWVLGITVDDNRIIYFTTGKALWKLNTTESSIPQLIVSQDSIFTFMVGLVWDGNDSLLICDGKGNRILRYNLNTKRLVSFAGTGVSGDRDGDIEHATFCNPWGITKDNNGNLFITDRNHVRKINLSEDTVTTIAGCTSEIYSGGHKDGLATKAMFDGPHGITVDKDGIIYVCDNSNFCIRRIIGSKVSTIAGTPGRSHFQDGTLKDSLFHSPGTLLMDEDDCLIVADIDSLRRINIKQNNVSSLLNIPSGKKDCLTSDSHGNMYVRVWTRMGHEPTGEILVLQNAWSVERFLWIGHLKEDARYCHLAGVPKEIIKEIVAQLPRCYVKDVAAPKKEQPSRKKPKHSLL